jgi:[acyl-carrier-protein] S-malonyltransferase
MGIYAAAHFARSISFADGLRVIGKAYELVAEAASGKDYGMGHIIGLDSNDIQTLLNPYGTRLVIINCNGEYNFIVAGTVAELNGMLAQAKQAGAIHSKLLPVKNPYHTQFIIRNVCPFRIFLKSILFNDPVVPLVSNVDQKLLTTAYDIKEEFIRNLYTPTNWFRTIGKLNDLGTTTYYECGAGESLYKINKFIDIQGASFACHQYDKIMG